MTGKLIKSLAGAGGAGTVFTGGSLATHNYVSNSPKPDLRWDNKFYKNVSTQLFKLDGTPVEQKFISNMESCEFCTQSPYKDNLYLRVIWERPNNVDWFGASKYESWYEIKGWSLFAIKDSYSVFWGFLEGSGNNNVTQKKFNTTVPEQIKLKTLTNEWLIRYF